MFDVFGEFDSAEEINKAAAGLLAEGDKSNLIVLAKENGIDEFTTEAYWNGETPTLTDYFTGAIGKLMIQKENLKSRMPVTPIVDYLSNLCMDEQFAGVVSSKSKNLKLCIESVEKQAKEECRRTNEQYIADMTVFEWAKEYYTGGNTDEQKGTEKASRD